MPSLPSPYVSLEVGPGENIGLLFQPSATNGVTEPLFQATDYTIIHVIAVIISVDHSITTSPVTQGE